MSLDVKVAHLDPAGSCPKIGTKAHGAPRYNAECRKTLIEWVKGPHDGTSAWVCERELVRKYPARILKVSKKGRCLCDEPGCRALFVVSEEGPLVGARAWFCSRELSHVAT